jgi:hypothetical protein
MATTPTEIPITKVVSVNISIQNVVPSQLDFGLMCLITEDFAVIPIAERYRKYSSLTDVEVDFNSTTDEFKAAEAFFAQAPTPLEFQIASVDTGSETYVEAITDANNKSRFYALTLTNLALVDATVQDISNFVQTERMLFFYQTSAADIYTPVTTDIASVIKDLNSKRTVIEFVEAPLESRFDNAFFGMGSTRVPTGIVNDGRDSINWAWQSLSLVEASSLTSAEQDIVLSKSVNLYSRVGGVDLTRLGQTSGQQPTYIDEIQGLDWTAVNLETEIFQLLAARDKIPYTDTGMASIKAVVKQVLNAGVNKAIYSANPAPTVTIDKVADVPASQKAARIAPTVMFTAELAGGVNRVIVNGTVSL